MASLVCCWRRFSFWVELDLLDGGEEYMISFTSTEDEQALLDTCARFAEQVLAPQTREADRENAISDRVRQQYRELGMPLLGLPETYGGSEFGLIAKVLAEEALARVDAAQAVALDEAGFAAQAVLLLA